MHSTLTRWQVEGSSSTVGSPPGGPPIQKANPQHNFVFVFVLWWPTAAWCGISVPRDWTWDTVVKVPNPNHRTARDLPHSVSVLKYNLCTWHALITCVWMDGFSLTQHTCHQHPAQEMEGTSTPEAPIPCLPHPISRTTTMLTSGRTDFSACFPGSLSGITCVHCLCWIPWLWEMPAGMCVHHSFSLNTVYKNIPYHPT